MRELHDAERASVDSGFRFKNFIGSWENDFASTQRSQFEMVLRAFLADCHDFSDEMISTIVDKRSPQGSASTPALTQGSASTPAQGDKGGDSGGGKKRKAGKGDKGGGQGGGQDDGSKKRKIFVE